MRAIALILGLVLNLMLYAGAGELGGLDGLQTFILLSLLNFVAILFHELGHAWAFRYVGGTVQRIVVMFLSYNVNRRRLGFYRGRSGGDVGGFVDGRYRPEGPTVRDKIIVAGAGPFANAVTGGLALLLAELFGGAFQLGDTALVLFGVLSIGLGLLNLLPYGGSDGQLIVRALRMRAAMGGKRRG